MFQNAFRLCKRMGDLVHSVTEWIFGSFALIFCLAVLASLPLLNLLSLGFLLHVTGQVAGSGRLLQGLTAIRKAAAVGRLILFTWLLLWPLRFFSDMIDSAYLIDSESNLSRYGPFLLFFLTFFTTAHLLWAVVRGSRMRHFIWPAPVRLLRWIVTPEKTRGLLKTAWDFADGLHLPHYFRTGTLGFLGTICWLALPISIIVAAGQLSNNGAAFLLSLLGSLILGWVVVQLPFLQAHFAIEKRFRALFELKQVRCLFRRAPIAFCFALSATLLSAIPLYLLKIELTPREIAWLPSLVYVTLILPARLITGWAVSRALQRKTDRHWFFRWTARLSMVPVVAVFVLLVYFTQYSSWHGTLSLLEQHAFLVPAPMLYY